MELKEATEMKSALETKIGHTLKAFEEMTGLKVRALKVKHVNHVNQNVIVSSDVFVEAEVHLE